jgi:hypothetical protein
MKSTLTIFLLIAFFTVRSQVTINTGALKISFDKKGNFSEITDNKNNINYLFKDTIAPLITLIVDQKRYYPSQIKYQASKRIITLIYPEVKSVIEIKVKTSQTYLTFEIIKAQPSKPIDGIVWGPIPVTISKIIGEIIGVVRDDKIGLGIQVLNIKTLGGDYNKEGQSWNRGDAAIKRNWGSILQAYTLNRDKPRFADTWGGEYKNTPVSPIKGETVEGSAIAIFLCDESKTLDIIEQIEIAENLPHQTINGIWVKKAIQRGRSYLIADFKESEIDEMIEFTKRAGLISLYHEGPFKNWGHYELNPDYFPSGKEGIKKCAEKARDAGLYFGVHTLTNFINTNDPYITPIPDDRLALTGYGILTDNIDEKTTEIPVSTKEYFDKQSGNYLNTLKIGKELIRYKTVTENPPYFLTDCQRGAFGTRISPHSKNDTIGKLYDHAYEVFFPNLELQREIAVNLARLFNETGISHLDFDGHEGCLASGQGDYAINLFAKDFYDNLDHEVLNGTSLSKTFYWHINTFCNWGEPWYGGFRESMQEYRIANQELFDRNFIPHMLGWYLLTKNTTLGEMEWMLARAAGYDAGFAMVARPKSIKANPIGEQLLDAIREWETARLSSAFSTEQKTRMKDPKNEFHLKNTGEGKWDLYQSRNLGQFIFEKIDRQPGEPAHAIWEFELSSFSQALQFKIDIRGQNGSARNLKILVDDNTELIIDQEIFPGETILCEGHDEIRVYDEKGKLKNNLNVNIPNLLTGKHKIRFSSAFSGDDAPVIHFTVKAFDNPESVKSKKNID